MRKSFFYFIIGAWASPAFSDTANFDLIFSDDLYKGAVLCSDLGSGYCEEPVPIYDSEAHPLNKQQKVLGACVQGGGDCVAVSFAYEARELKDGMILAKIRDDSKKFVFIKIEKKLIKPIESFIPELGTGANEVKFRPDFKDIFLDKKLENRLDKSVITKLPNGRELDPEKEEIEYILTDSFTVNKKRVLEIKINLIVKDLKALKESRDLDAIEKGKRIELRKIYFPTLDPQGRISYWFVPQSC